MTKVTLHVWEDQGGLSTCWEGPQEIVMGPFFLFGRYGGGFAPFGRLDARAREKAEAGAERARERYGIEVVVVYGRPEGTEERA